MKELEVFNEIVAKSATRFSDTSAEVLKNVFGIQCTPEGPASIGELSSEHDFFVSILFTGVVYGEYILAMEEKTAALLLGLDTRGKTMEELKKVRVEVGDAFCEALNMIVGESVVNLNQIYKKITITPPKVNFGSVRYPKVSVGRARLNTSAGPIECYLYVDRMKLDIADSYQEALSSAMVAHRELQLAVEQLQAQQALLVQAEKMAALGTMAAGVAHEINTPLATTAIVSGQMKQALNNSAKDIDRAAFLKLVDMIEKTVARIARITDNMRIFASEFKTTAFSTHKVKDVIDNAILMCAQLLENHNVEVRYTAPAESLMFDARGSEMTQMLLSLIHNAVDAIEHLPEKWIEIKCADFGDKIEIRVTDSGHGIPVEIRKKIFDPFFTTKGIGKGNGLGLSTAIGIVGNHCGEIAVDASHPNTSFYIRLPKKQIIRKAA